MFSGKKIPFVGISIGKEKIFNILEKHYKINDLLRSNYTDVLVYAVGKN